MPALNALHDMINENGKYFKVAFSLSGTGIEQLEYHAPQVIEKLQKMNETGCVEFLAEPYSHGLSSLANEETFALDVKKQAAKIEELFGKKPTVLRNSSRLLLWASRVCSPRVLSTCSDGRARTMCITVTSLRT